MFFHRKQQQTVPQEDLANLKIGDARLGDTQNAFLGGARLWSMKGSQSKS